MPWPIQSWNGLDIEFHCSGIQNPYGLVDFGIIFPLRSPILHDIKSQSRNVIPLRRSLQSVNPWFATLAFQFPIQILHWGWITNTGAQARWHFSKYKLSFHGYCDSKFLLLLLLSTNPIIIRASPQNHPCLHPNLPAASPAVPVGHNLKLFPIMVSNIPTITHTRRSLYLVMCRFLSL